MWQSIIDGHPGALALANRHYSRKKPDSPIFVGPGDRIVLITEDENALFVWRRSVYRRDGQRGIECSLFRNEGPQRSSELIREACLWAWQRWPGERLFTYVNGRKVKSTNPGYCFLMAGWKQAGRSKQGLLILENTEPVYSVPKGMQMRVAADTQGMKD